MSIPILDTNGESFDLEGVRPGTCLSVDDDDWFVFRVPDGWIDSQGTSWSSEQLVDYVEDGGGYPRFERLN